MEAPKRGLRFYKNVIFVLLDMVIILIMLAAVSWIYPVLAVIPAVFILVLAYSKIRCPHCGAFIGRSLTMSARRHPEPHCIRCGEMIED